MPTANKFLSAPENKMPANTNRVFIFAAQTIVAELTAFRLKLLEIAPVILKTEDELEAALEEGIPSLFIVDLDLTEIDSAQLIERLSSDEITSRIPVMCMSSEGDMDRAEKAYMAGARDFLVIPFDPIVLEKKVRAALDNPKFASSSRDAAVKA